MPHMDERGHRPLPLASMTLARAIREGWLRAIGVVVLLTFVSIAFTPLSDLLTAAMSPAGETGTGDAIVVLGGGGLRADGSLTDISMRRTLRGIALYRRRVAGLLVLAGSDRGSGHTEIDARVATAVDCGVPRQAILAEPHGRTTREETQDIATLLRRHGIRKIVLVVDTQGMSRAARLFENAGFAVVGAPVGDVPDTGGGPGSRLERFNRVLIEAAAWGYYLVAGYL